MINIFKELCNKIENFETKTSKTGILELIISIIKVKNSMDDIKRLDTAREV